MNRIRGMGLFMTVLAVAGLSLRGDAATKYRPCSLLTSAELEVVLGSKVERSDEQDISIAEGAYKGETMSSCTWIAGSTIGASLSVLRGHRTSGPPRWPG